MEPPPSVPTGASVLPGPEVAPVVPDPLPSVVPAVLSTVPPADSVLPVSVPASVVSDDGEG